MLLKEMKLVDFRQFKGEQTVSFATDAEKNVTVIMGQNGSGKTTFAQAFTWCLYSTTDFSDQNLICKSTAQDMLPNTMKTVSVRLILMHKNRQYELIREQDYRKGSDGEIKSPRETRFNISYKNNDGQQEFISPNQLDYCVKEILPKELSKYFFFDGERIGNMSKEIQGGRSSEFPSAVKSLLGLDSYVSALEHLKGQRTGKSTVIGSYNDQYDSNSDTRFRTYSDDIARLQAELEKADQRIDELTAREKTAEERCEELLVEISRNKDSEELAAKKTSLIAKRKRNQDILNGSSETILKKFHSQYHSYFAHKLMSDAIEILSETDKLDKGIPDIHKRTIDYLIQHGQCICGNKIELDNEAHRNLIKLLQFIPPQSVGTLINGFVKDCENKLRYGYSLFDDMTTQLQTYREREDELADIDKDIEAIDSKLANFNSDAVRKMQSDYTRYRDEKAKAKSELAQKREYKGSLESNIKQKEASRQELALKSDNNKKIEIYKAYALRMFDTLNAEYKTEETRVRNELEKSINEIFQNIYAGGLSLTIDDKYNIETIVNDFGNYNVGVETSTAQSISIIFAFISGVIKMARENQKSENSYLVTEAYPLVMDAPLSAFDKERIQTVCKTLPNIAEQVIIFIKDTDGEIAEKYLSSKIGKSFTFNKKNEFETYLEVR